MGQVIAVDFRRSVPPPHDFELVRRLGRQAAAVLTRHAGRAKLSVDVDSVSVTAEVVGQFALSLLASSFCPRRPAGISLREWLTTPQQRQLGLDLHPRRGRGRLTRRRLHHALQAGPDRARHQQ
jgi:hypothetical protein